MLRCKNCGGNLIFDIARQDVCCVYCNSHYDPAEYADDRGADESDSYDTTVYTCTQCGAVITSPDNAAVGFCSFCGTEAVLESRIAKERRPVRIIPFQKTKEDCRRIYTELAAASPYAPAEFKDPAFLDRFRGIYIPYWQYHFSFAGNPQLKVTDSYTSGDYVYTEEYTVTPNLDQTKGDIAFDASSGFDDEISGAISPYTDQHTKEFSPAYMAGFFGDTADVAQDIYQQEATAQVQDQIIASITSRFRSATVHIARETAKRAEVFGTSLDEVTSDLYPVWFLTWRKNRRVAYAVINGETGSAYAEIPVDIPAFLKRSGLIAVVLFIILTLAGTLLRPMTIMLLTGVTACVTQFLCRSEIMALRKRERKDYNLGALQPERAEKAIRQMEKKRKSKQGGCMLAFVIMMGVFFLPMLFFAEAVVESAAVCGFVLVVVSLVICLGSLPAAFSISEKSLLPGMILPVVMEIYIMMVSYENPIDDWRYYLAALLTMGVTLLSALLLLTNYNHLCTRGVPDFHDRKGGARYEAG